MLEGVIVTLISTGIAGIIGAYIKSWQQKITDLEEPNNGENPNLNSLEVEIRQPRDGETITNEGQHPINGIIRNIPEGMQLNNLSKELGLYVLHTGDDGKAFWRQSDIEKDINSNGQDTVEFYSSHWVISSRKVLIVSVGEKAKGAIEFHQKGQKAEVFEKSNIKLHIPREIIGSDIKVLAKVHINFNPK